MPSKPLNPLDASWLLVESRETPMHVGALIPFTLPDDAPADFLVRLMADLRGCKRIASPWNLRFRGPGLKGLLPVWVEEDDIDLEHHVRLSALPKPGGERELGQMIARLHSQPLDLSRPPWECELIEGLEGRRFAIYMKMHHSLIDGISGIKLLERSMTADRAASRDLPPFWAVGADAGKGKKKGKDKGKPAPVATATGVLETLREQLGSLPDIARAFGAMFGRGKDDALEIPFDTPASILNGRVKGQRRFATQQFPLARLKAVAQAADATLNDVVLALCGAALRRFLLELGELPEKSLTAGIPVSVRPKDDEGTGNAITFIISTLGTDIEDARERLDAIRASTTRAKEHVQSLPKKAMMQYTMVLMAPYMLTLVAGVGGRTRPMFNVTISNVPGPEQPLYFRGARMDATFPVSLVSHGQALNITCQSYAGTLAFGFTGCRDTLPHMQRLAPYTREALEELERAVLGKRAKAQPAKKAAAKKARKNGAKAAPVTRPAPKRIPPKRAPARAKPAAP